MKQLTFDVGDRVYIKGREAEGLFEIYDETCDSEGHVTYHIHQDWEDGGMDEDGLYSEELIAEDEYNG